MSIFDKALSTRPSDPSHLAAFSSVETNVTCPVVPRRMNCPRIALAGIVNSSDVSEQRGMGLAADLFPCKGWAPFAPLLAQFFRFLTFCFFHLMISFHFVNRFCGLVFLFWRVDFEISQLMSFAQHGVP